PDEDLPAGFALASDQVPPQPSSRILALDLELLGGGLERHEAPRRPRLGHRPSIVARKRARRAPRSPVAAALHATAKASKASWETRWMRTAIRRSSRRSAGLPPPLRARSWSSTGTVPAMTSGESSSAWRGSTALPVR